MGANRLYRQTVVRAGEPGMASLLEELERLLVEVAHRPSVHDAGGPGRHPRAGSSRGDSSSGSA